MEYRLHYGVQSTEYKYRVLSRAYTYITDKKPLCRKKRGKVAAITLHPLLYSTLLCTLYSVLCTLY